MKQRKHSFLFRLSVLVLAIALCMAFAQANGAENELQCYQHGDVNGDGVIDSRDAIHLLYHLQNEDDPAYAVNQDCEFDGTEGESTDDAIWLLYSSFDIFADSHPLEGEIHQYYAPEWSWDTTAKTAEAVFKCACGQKQTQVAAIAETVNPATCTESGSAVYTAEVEFQGVVYSAQNTVVIPAINHVFAAQTCAGEVPCENGCGVTLPALAHDWKLDEEKSWDATCTEAGQLTYSCAGCEGSRVSEIPVVPHEYAYKGEVNVAENDCALQKQYICSDCGAETLGEVFYKHEFTAVLTKEATCSQDGEKLITCSHCGHQETEAVAADPSKHVWDQGTEADGVITYTCTDCKETKTAISAAKGESVDKTALAENELQIENVSVHIDEDTLNGLGDQVSVDVDEKSVVELDLELTEEQIAQIGTNPVYDFNMADTEGQVSKFDGLVTISLPYTLQEDDDPDCIDVWFISDDGTIEIQKGTYANGYVSFATDHFSYYTVTRLTAAQRCEAYGHQNVETKVDATCNNAGQHIIRCKRCGEYTKNEVLPKLVHAYVQNEEMSFAATCTKDGVVVKICDNCKNKTTEVLPALGHSWKQDDAGSYDATCTETGRKVYRCECGETYAEELAMLDHSYQTVVTAPTCTEKGYTTHTCACGKSYQDSEIAPLGHTYEVSGWTWEEEFYEFAELKLVCHCGHEKQLNAVVTAKQQGCSGKFTYTATVTYNGKVYTDQVQVQKDKEHHRSDGQWHSDETHHYHMCKDCPTPLNKKDHVWSKKVSKKAPTCVNSGLSIQTCNVCGYEKQEIIPATGEHDYVNGECSGCGRKQMECSHIQNRVQQVDLSGYNICPGNRITVRSCECGKVASLEYSLNCGLQYVDSRMETSESGSTYEVRSHACRYCGLVYEWGEWRELDPQSCKVDSYYTNTLKIDGTILARGEQQTQSTEHFADIIQDEVNLSAYGMCNTKVQLRSCYCGEHYEVYSVESDCDLMVVHEQCTDTVTVYECRVCHAILRTERTISVDGCKRHEEFTGSYIVKGETVFVRDHYAYDTWMHENQVVGSELVGKDCVEGVLINYVCRNCGDESTDFVYGRHYGVHTTVVELGAKYCTENVVVESCPCGKYSNVMNNACAFSYAGWDEATNTHIYDCDYCDLVRKEHVVVTEKDDKCWYGEHLEFTYCDSETGEVLAELAEKTLYRHHNFETHVELANGVENCEDGVFQIRRCADCGYEEASRFSHHATLEVDRVTLSDYGMCGGYFSTEACACGEKVYDVDEDYVCLWERVDDSSWYCSYCGTTKTESISRSNPDACEGIETTTYTYTRDGEVVLTVNLDEPYNEHIIVYDLTALGEHCSDGYTVAERCIVCGEKKEIDHTYFGCGTWRTNVEYVSENDLCGPVYINTFSCACGYEMSSQVVLPAECRWEEYYDGDLSRWVRKCSECNTLVVPEYSLRDSDVPCQTIEVTTRIFYRDGQELLRCEELRNGYSHNFLYTFEMDGETCANGYRGIGTCTKCGYSYKSSTYYHCADWKVGSELISAEGVCERIVKEYYNCACGASECSVIDWETRCDFGGHYINGILGCEVQICSYCGTERSSKGEQIFTGEKCKYRYQHTYTYYKDNVEVMQVVYHNKYNIEHQLVYHHDLYGETCDEGYTVYETCLNCDYSCSWWSESGCYARRISTELVTTDAVCAVIYKNTFSCACGKDQYSNVSYEKACRYDGSLNYYDSELGVTVEVCPDCGAEHYTRSEYVSVGESCKYRWEKTYVYRKNGVELVRIETEGSVYTSHENVYSYVMYGETCDDGYDIYRTCLVCGESGVASMYNYGCSSYRTARELVSTEEMCAVIYKDTYSCACGQNYYSRLEFEQDCDYSEPGYTDPETGMWINPCAVCGVEYIGTSTYVPTGNPCEYREEYVRIYRKDGVELARIETLSNTVNRHKYIYSFELMGETCDDGYWETGTCVGCGDSYTRSYPEYGCNSWYMLERQVLYDGGDVCGPIVLATRGCACGAYRFFEVEQDCSWNYKGWDEELQADIRYCSTCGLEFYHRENHWQDPEHCVLHKDLEVYYRLNGEVLVHQTYSTQEVEHPSVYSFQLMGESCDDGYQCTTTCMYCGKTTQESGMNYGHTTYLVGRHNLEELGLCGGYIDVIDCACGRKQGMNCYDDACQWIYVRSEQDGTQVYHCTECDTYRYHRYSDEKDAEACTRINTTMHRYERDGQVLLELELVDHEESHDYVVDYFEMYGENCDDGYYVYVTCVHCGQKTRWDVGGHGEMPIERIDLSDYSPCGGILRKYSCGCGMAKDLDWESNCANRTSRSWSDTINGQHYDYEEYACEDCGLRLLRTTYFVDDPANCVTYRYETNTMYYGFTEISSVTYQEVQENHSNGEFVWMLKEGSSTCEDGLVGSTTCQVCGREATVESYDHNMNRVETIDMSQYGAVCNTDLVGRECPCGRYRNYELEGEGHCDVQYIWQEPWIDNVLNDVYQENVNGGIWYYSSFYKPTCAVTDPVACGLNVRYADYWLVEDCIATHYEVWQLGYDEATDTCQREIVCATGETSVYHNYEETFGSETLEDGTNVDRTTKVCSDCGSWCEYEYTYDQTGNTVREKRTFVNTLDNGQNKRRCYIYEWADVYMGHYSDTLNRHEYTYADGSEYWYQYAYTYFLPDRCVRRVDYMNSNNETNSYEEAFHIQTWSREDICNRSCSQPYVYMDAWTCILCGDRYGHTYTEDPWDHWWVQNEDGLYYCERCGMENENGASGSIILEDLTEAYGNETDYVVGYFNRNGVEVISYVSVILKDAAENIDGEILLDVNTNSLTAQNDGINAITFSQAEALAAAQTAMAEAGYNGAYAIRFTFVPVNADDTLDYAITFDSLDA